MFKIGVVVHFFDKIGVATIELGSGLAVGETVKFVKDGEDLFSQKIESIQLEHEKVDFADRGNLVGIKTVQEVKDGTEVFKVA